MIDDRNVSSETIKKGETCFFFLKFFFILDESRSFAEITVQRKAFLPRFDALACLVFFAPAPSHVGPTPAQARDVCARD